MCRHYQEVELPRLSQSSSKKSGNAVWDVADPRNQGPGCSRDPDWAYQDKEEDGDVTDPGLRPERPVETKDVPELYRGEEARGFHISSGRNWIYPTNYVERKYQFDIVEKALYQNTLVSLPTGLGKTFIAAVVMYNFYRWYPEGKIVFTAPTKPLVNQQVESCYKVMGIPKEDTVEMTGSMAPSSRKQMWQTKRVVFVTPQTITNDLTSGLCPVESIRCVIIDEAHKALKNYHYCQLVKSIAAQNKHFRLLALSATPGSNVDAIKQVVQNLLISHIEVRTEVSPDITPYTHTRNVEAVILKPSPVLKTYLERFLCIIDMFARQLRVNKLLCGNTLTKYGLVTAQQRFYQNPPSGFNPNMKGPMAADFALCIPLCYAKEMLETSGLRAFYNTMETLRCNPEKQSLASRLEKCEPFQELIAEVKAYVDKKDISKQDPNLSILNPTQIASGPQYVGSHPKMEKVRDILLEHFSESENKTMNSKVIIFCEFRETVDEVQTILNQLRPIVRPRIFVGQSDTKNSKGLKQNQQKKILQQFRGGHTNTLVSTCVGEEGLDIGEVDLIVCYDVVAHTRLVQRMGRTGRKREGRIIHLVSEGKEYMKYKTALRQNIDVTQKIASDSNQLKPFLYQQSPAMFPQGMEQPTCRKILMTPKQEEVAPKVAKNQDLRTFMTKGTKKERKVFLTEDMYRGLFALHNGNNPADCEGLLPPQSFLCHMTIDALQEQQLNDNALAHSNKIDLGDYIDWQRLMHGGPKAHHSTDTGILVDLMAYSDKLNTEGLNDSITGYEVDQLVEVVCKTKTKPKKKQTYTKKLVGKTPVKKEKKSAPVKVNIAKNNIQRFLQTPEEPNTTGSTNAQQAVEQKGILDVPYNENEQELDLELPAEKLAICERLLKELGKIDIHMSSVNPMWERHMDDCEGTVTSICCRLCNSGVSHKDLKQQPKRTHEEKTEEVLQWEKEHYKTNSIELSNQTKDTDANLVNMKDENGNGSDLELTSTYDKKHLNFDLGLDNFLIEDDDDAILVDLEHQTNLTCANKQQHVENNGAEGNNVDTMQCQPRVDQLEQTKSAYQNGPSKRVEVILSPILPSQKTLRTLQSKKTCKGVETAMSPILKSQRHTGNNSKQAKKMKLSLHKKPGNSRNTVFYNQLESQNKEGLFVLETSPAVLEMATPDTKEVDLTHLFASSSEEKQTPQRLRNPNPKAKKKLDMHSINASTSDLISVSGNTITNVEEEKREVVCETTDKSFKSPILGKSTKGKLKKVPTHNFLVSPILALQSQSNGPSAAILGPVSSTPKRHIVALFAPCTPEEASSSRVSPAVAIPNKPDSMGRISSCRPSFTKTCVLTPITEEGSSVIEDSPSLIEDRKNTSETTEIVSGIHFNVYDDDNIDNIFEGVSDDETQIDFYPTEVEGHQLKIEACNSKSVHNDTAYEESMYTLDQMLAKVDAPKRSTAQTSNLQLERKRHKGDKENRRLSLKGSLSRPEGTMQKTNVDMCSKPYYDGDEDLFASDDESIQQYPVITPNSMQTYKKNEIGSSGELNNIETFNNAHAKTNRIENKDQENVLPSLAQEEKNTHLNSQKDQGKVSKCSSRGTVKKIDGFDNKVIEQLENNNVLAFSDVSILKKMDASNTKDVNASLKRKMNLSISSNNEDKDNSKPLRPKKEILNISLNIPYNSKSNLNNHSLSSQTNRSDEGSPGKLNKAKRLLLFDIEDTQDLWKQADSRLEESRLACGSQSSPCRKETSEQCSPIWPRRKSASASKHSLDKSKSRGGNTSFDATTLESSPVLGGKSANRSHNVSTDSNSTIGLKKKPRVLANISTTSEESSLTKKLIKGTNRGTSVIGLVKPSLAQTNNIGADSECSSSSDDNFEKPPGSEKLTSIGKENKGKISNTVTTPVKRAKTKSVHVGRPKGCEFVDNEASESTLDHRNSSDGENTSGLDDYDESFVHDDASQPTMMQNIQAQYIKYKIDAPDLQYNRHKPKVDCADVFSQVGDTAEDDTYLNDSFVNDASSDMEAPSEMSVLEMAEYRLRKAHKRKRKKRKRTSLGIEPVSSDESETESQKSRRCGKSVKNKKRRRIITQDSSESAANNSIPSEVNCGNDKITKTTTKSTSSTHQINQIKAPHQNHVSNCYHPSSYNSEALDTHNYKDLLEHVNWDDNLYNIDTVFIPEPEDNQPKHIYGSSSKATTSINSSSRTDSGPAKCNVFNTCRKTTLTSHTFSDEGKKSSTSVVEKINRPELSKPSSIPLVLIVAQRQVAVASAIVSQLRSKHRVQIMTQSMQEADFVVSWRMGVARISLNDFTSNNSKDVEKIVNSLRSAFQKPYLIVENDKKKELCPSGSNSSMWNFSKKTLAKLIALRPVTKVVYTLNYEETARFLAKLLESETKLGHRIELWPARDLERVNDRVHFYYSLPGVNYATALRLQRLYPHPYAFINLKTDGILAATGVTRETAAQIKLVLKRPCHNQY